MCDVCGCSGEARAAVHHDPGEHEHVLEGGTVMRHTHAPHEALQTEAQPGAKTGAQTEALGIRVLEKNDRLAERNRGWFHGREVLALNLMSSPGSGKTTLLERTLRDLGTPAAVIEGDQATTFDADRIRATGTEVVQINTGKGCHLEAEMVWRGLEQLKVPSGAVLFIENVGNLICPALFDLGERLRVILFSITEGEDKPLKYPHMFRAADLVVFTKLDLLPHLDFDLDAATSAVRTVAHRAQVLFVSARTGTGLGAWYDWIQSRRSL